VWCCGCCCDACARCKGRGRAEAALHAARGVSLRAPLPPPARPAQPAAAPALLPSAAHPHPRSVPQHCGSGCMCLRRRRCLSAAQISQRPACVCSATAAPQHLDVGADALLLCCCSSISAKLAPRSVCRARACARLGTTPRSRWRRLDAAGICVVRAGQVVHAPPQAAMLEGVSMKARRRRRATGGAIFPRGRRTDAADVPVPPSDDSMQGRAALRCWPDGSAATSSTESLRLARLSVLHRC
jgi:hypothetical protein